MPAVELQRYHWGSYTGGPPTEYALLRGWSQDVSSWTYQQQIEFQKWTNGMSEEAGFGNYARPRPNYASDVEEGMAPGFGPGSYRDGYTGAGDSTYWGNREQLSEIAASEGIEMQELETILETHSEAMSVGGYGGDQSSRAASEWSGRPSEWGEGSLMSRSSGVPSESMYSGSWQTSTQGSMGSPSLQEQYAVGGEEGSNFPSISEAGPPRRF